MDSSLSQSTKLPPSLSSLRPLSEALTARDLKKDPQYDPSSHNTHHGDENVPSDRPRLPDGPPNEQRNLLTLKRGISWDHNSPSPKHRCEQREYSETVTNRLGQYLQPSGPERITVVAKDSRQGAMDSIAPKQSETSPLLGDHQQPHGGDDSPANIMCRWEETVKGDEFNRTTWQLEAKILTRYSWSLVLTFLLQYSLTLSSVFAVGHLGRVELAAASLAALTANISGYFIYDGLVTSLDTLCPQAYGSGRKHLVGLQMQRMIWFLSCVTIPIGLVWFNAASILQGIVPQRDLANLAGKYLRVLLIGTPGYFVFESGKRYLQAQGIFLAGLYVLLFCAPLNALLNWLFVWHFGIGFIGAPIAVAVTNTLMPICLFLYVFFIDGKECWGGFSRWAFQNWGPMIRLAIPCLIMLLAEAMCFELLTIAASYISTTHLAAQSVSQMLCTTAFHIPFAMTIASSTRIANLIGAAQPKAAKTSARVSVVAACVIGTFNAVLLGVLRNLIPRLFTSNPDVTALVSRVLVLVAAFQLFDSLATACNGILKGVGRQKIGSWANLFCYYIVALPISLATAFGLHWNLFGLWAGPAVGLAVVCAIEGWFICRMRWEDSVDAARKRNLAG